MKSSIKYESQFESYAGKKDSVSYNSKERKRYWYQSDDDIVRQLTMNWIWIFSCNFSSFIVIQIKWLFFSFCDTIMSVFRCWATQPSGRCECAACKQSCLMSVLSLQMDETCPNEEEIALLVLSFCNSWFTFWQSWWSFCLIITEAQHLFFY